MSDKGISIAFLGEVGIVGNELLQTLAKEEFPLAQKKILLSEKHLAQEFPSDDEGFDMEFIAENSFAGVDLVLIMGHEDLAIEYALKAAAAGCLTLDATGAYGSDPRIPLVSPVLDPDALEALKPGTIAALPLSISVSIAYVVKAFLELSGVQELFLCSLHGVSDLGREAMAELTSQSIAVLNFQKVAPGMFPMQLAFNCLPQVGPFGREGDTVVEEDIAVQVPRLLGVRAGSLHLAVTALQVPIFYGHAFAATLVLDKDVEQKEIAGIFAALPYIEFTDTEGKGAYPHPVGVVGDDRIHIGRVRRVDTWPRAWQVWAAADNVRFGATLNIWEIIKRVFGEKKS